MFLIRALRSPTSSFPVNMTRAQKFLGVEFLIATVAIAHHKAATIKLRHYPPGRLGVTGRAAATPVAAATASRNVSAAPRRLVRT